MDCIFTMDEDDIVKQLRREIKELTKQKNEIQIKYDRLIGKLKEKKITPEQQEIISIFHPVKINNYLEKY